MYLYNVTVYHPNGDMEQLEIDVPLWEAAPSVRAAELTWPKSRVVQTRVADRLG